MLQESIVYASCDKCRLLKLKLQEKKNHAIRRKYKTGKFLAFVQDLNYRNCWRELAIVRIIQFSTEVYYEILK